MSRIGAIGQTVQRSLMCRYCILHSFQWLPFHDEVDHDGVSEFFLRKIRVHDGRHGLVEVYEGFRNHFGELGFL